MFFFFNDTATTEIYTLSLHDALPIFAIREQDKGLSTGEKQMYTRAKKILASELMYALDKTERSEEHTSELQSRQYLVCRLLLEKKKNYHTSCCDIDILAFVSFSAACS